MALSALKGKKIKKKVVRSRKAKTGLAYVPLTNFHNMCDYVHMEVERREIVSFVKKFTKENYEKKYWNLQEWVYYHPVTVMSVLWKNTGQPFPPKWDHDRVLSSFKERLIEFSNRVNGDKTSTPKITRSPMAIIKDRTSDFIAGVEDILDNWLDNENYSIFDELKKVEASFFMAKGIKDFYLGLYSELEELVVKKDKEISEIYNHLTTDQQKSKYNFVKRLMDELDSYIATKKASRAVRAPKIKSADKQINKLNYLKESKEYKLASINPLSIVGAYRIYTFNTSNKVLSEIVSNSTKGFQVSGSTLKNVDTDNSRCIILRNPDKVLPTVLSGTTKAIDKAWSTLTTKTNIPNARINKYTILLKVTDK